MHLFMYFLVLFAKFLTGGSILGIIVGAILMILFPLCLLALVGNFIFYKVGFKKLVVFEVIKKNSTSHNFLN